MPARSLNALAPSLRRVRLTVHRPWLTSARADFTALPRRAAGPISNRLLPSRDGSTTVASALLSSRDVDGISAGFKAVVVVVAPKTGAAVVVVADDGAL